VIDVVAAHRSIGDALGGSDFEDSKPGGGEEPVEAEGQLPAPALAGGMSAR